MHLCHAIINLEPLHLKSAALIPLGEKQPIASMEYRYTKVTLDPVPVKSVDFYHTQLQFAVSSCSCGCAEKGGQK